MTEEWRDIPSWEGLYEVSSLGRIRTVARLTPRGNRWGTMGTQVVPARIRKQTRNPNGYIQVCLKRGGLTTCLNVHRAVCQAFHGPAPEGHEAAHGDGDRANNHKGNLRWATRSDNHIDKRVHGTAKPSALSNDTIARIQTLALELPQKEIASMFGISRASVCRIVNRSRRSFQTTLRPPPP